MIWRKITVILIGVFFLGVWGQTENATRPQNTEEKTKMADVTPEVREKAFGLLNEVLVESETLKGNLSKLEIQFEIADILWEKDETKAKMLFRSIFENEEICQCQNISIERVAARDAKFAGEIQNGDVVFEYLVKQYPQEVLEEAKESLTDNFAESFSRSSGNRILEKLNIIYAHNPQNGADFARAILAKLKENKLNIPYTNYNANMSNRIPMSNRMPVSNANMPTNSNLYLERNYPTNTPANYYSNIPSNASFPNSNVNRNVEVNDVSFADVRSFFEMVLASRESDQTGETQRQIQFGNTNSLIIVGKKGQSPMLTESEIRELAKLMVNALITAKKTDSYQIRGIYNELKKYAPAEMAKLEKRLSPKQLREIKEPRNLMDFPSKIPTLPDVNSSNSTKQEKLPVSKNETTQEKDEREFIDHIRYVLKNYSHCNVEEDAVIFARITNKNKYPDMVEYFEEYMPKSMAKIGNVKELRGYLKKESDNSKKIELLSLAADAVSTQNDKNDLAELLKESKVTIPKQYKNVTEFKLMMNYAKILSAISPAQSFEYLESLLNNVNEIINSAAVVAEFSEHESQESGEFRFTKMQEQIAKNSPLSIGMIKKLAHFDFERTKKLADKFARPEVRLFIKWHIANSLLNKNAPDEEAKFYEVEVCG
ncbi:hypothetical protein BH10ACI1_BH10ACI1_08640 [soil metagenome]